MKLNVRAFAVAFGVWWGVGVFLGTWWVIALSGATGEPTFLARIYVGYEISPLGSIIGFAWGAIDALIAGPYSRGSTTPSRKGSLLRKNRKPNIEDSDSEGSELVSGSVSARLKRAGRRGENRCLYLKFWERRAAPRLP